MLTWILLLIVVTGLVVMVYSLVTAPAGDEDADGWHPSVESGEVRVERKEDA